MCYPRIIELLYPSLEEYPTDNYEPITRSNMTILLPEFQSDRFGVLIAISCCSSLKAG